MSERGHPHEAGPMGSHHLLLCFQPSGGVTFFPETRDAEELAARLQQLLRLLIENPSAIACAAGHHPPP
jgi:hypothetical protein